MATKKTATPCNPAAAPGDEMTNSTKHTPMVIPACDQHGQMEHQPASSTPEQAWCGVWYRCSKCTNTVLLPSANVETLSDAEFDALHGGRELLPIEQAIYEAEGAERFAKFHGHGRNFPKAVDNFKGAA